MKKPVTCAPSNIRYPQDFSLLNEAREKLETIIIRFCKSYGFSRPRMYRRQARKNYLALAKAKKRSTKKIRATIRKQLAYIKRDIGYLESYMEEGYAPTSKEVSLLMTIYKLYEQQQHMYQNKVHSVENRIVSISQPWIRPIVRGKTKAPVEFGPKLGRPSLTKQSSKEKKQEYQDNTDRIEVECSFSLSKRCYGMDLIRTKLYDTTLTSIALSVFVTNLFKIQSRILFALIYLLELIGLQPADFEPETV